MLRLITLFTLLVAVASCHKDGGSAQRLSMGIPSGDHPAVINLMGSYANVPLPSSVPNVWGVFIADRYVAALLDTGGVSSQIDLKWEEAVFSKINGFDQNVNSVYINGVSLGWYAISYLNPDSTGIWNDNIFNDWIASGNNNDTLVAEHIDGAFPEFTGVLPDTVSVNDTFSYTLNASDFQNADSAYIWLQGNSELLGSNVVNTGGGTISIPSLQILGNQYYVYNNHVYYGGWLRLVVYKHVIGTYAGKSFAFVKQKEVLKQVVYTN